MTTSAGTEKNNLMKVLLRVWEFIKKIPPVFPIFIVLFVIVTFLSPTYSTATGIMAFLRRTAPLGILAIGMVRPRRIGVP